MHESLKRAKQFYCACTLGRVIAPGSPLCILGRHGEYRCVRVVGVLDGLVTSAFTTILAVAATYFLKWSEAGRSVGSVSSPGDARAIFPSLDKQSRKGRSINLESECCWPATSMDIPSCQGLTSDRGVSRYRLIRP